jgi:hypothetical protein
MPSGATAGTGAGGHDNRSGNDNDVAPVRTTSTHRTAVKARTAAAFYLDDHVGRSLARGKACAALPDSPKIKARATSLFIRFSLICCR